MIFNLISVMNLRAHLRLCMSCVTISSTVCSVFQCWVITHTMGEYCNGNVSQCLLDRNGFIFWGFGFMSALLLVSHILYLICCEMYSYVGLVTPIPCVPLIPGEWYMLKLVHFCISLKLFRYLIELHPTRNRFTSDFNES